MHRSKPEKFSELLLRVRQTLVHPPPGLQSDSLATLLLLLESHLLRWPSALPDKTGVRERTMIRSNTDLLCRRVVRSSTGLPSSTQKSSDNAESTTDAAEQWTQSKGQRGENLISMNSEK